MRFSILVLIFLSFVTEVFADRSDFTIRSRENGGNVIIAPKNASGSETVKFEIDPDTSIISIPTGNLGLGIDTPLSKLHIKTGSAGGGIPHVNMDDVTIETAGLGGITVLSPTNGWGYLAFGDSDDTDVSYISYTHGLDRMSFATNGADRMHIDSSGKVGIGTSSPGWNFEVKGSSSAIASNNTTTASASTVFLAENSSIKAGFIAYGSTHVTSADELWIKNYASGGEIKIAPNGGSTAAVTIDSSGNVGIGRDSSSVMRLGIQGLGTTSSTYAIQARNSTSTNIFQARDDLAFLTNSGSVDGASSDIRLKENFREITDALSTILALSPKFYDWKHPEFHTDVTQAGFIAQEVEQVKPNWVQIGSPPKEELEKENLAGQKTLTTKLQDLNAYIVKAIQELHSEKVDLQEIIESQKSKMDLMKDWICSQNNAPNALCN